jgi:hypothetical protein
LPAAGPVAAPPSPDHSGSGEANRARVPARIGCLLFALFFQFATFLALFIVVHILRGHYEGSSYTSAQRVDAAVLGLPSAALGVSVLLAALYTLFTGRKPGLVFKLALAAIVVFAVSYGLELALK